MSYIGKDTKCIKCGKPIKVKAFILFKGKKVAGKGYLCADCAKKAEESKNKEAKKAQ